MGAIISDLFGRYTPNYSSITTVDAEGVTTTVYQIANGAAGVDWEWVAGVALFAICLIGVMKIAGKVIGG